MGKISTENLIKVLRNDNFDKLPTSLVAAVRKQAADAIVELENYKNGTGEYVISKEQAELIKYYMDTLTERCLLNTNGEICKFCDIYCNYRKELSEESLGDSIDRDIITSVMNTIKRNDQKGYLDILKKEDNNATGDVKEKD